MATIKELEAMISSPTAQLEELSNGDNSSIVDNPEQPRLNLAEDINWKTRLRSIDEEIGTVHFNLVDIGNIFDPSLHNVVFFDEEVKSSKFALYRNNDFDLVFEHWNPLTGVRIAKINLKAMGAFTGLLIIFSWSKEENKLHVGGLDEKGELYSAKAEDMGIKVRVDKDGQLWGIGGKGFEVARYEVRKDGEIILKPTAKEIWDFNLTKISTLVKNAKVSDYLFETTLLQQCLVMFATGFEVYTDTRFNELSAYNNSRDKGKKINFQNWEECKHAYNQVLGIKFGEIGFKSEVIEGIKKCLGYRHLIIHTGHDMSALNMDNVPPEEPVFLNIDFIKKAQEIFCEFIEKVHEETNKKKNSCFEL